MRAMRVLHGPQEVVGKLGVTAKALREIGVQAESCAYERHPNNYETDYCLRMSEAPFWKIAQMKMGLFALWAIARYDTFHFYYGETLLPNNSDLSLLKKLKKKMVMEFCGSDIRMPSIASKNPYYVNSYGESDERSMALMKRLAKFIDVAVVGDHELYEYASPFFRKTIVLPRRADTRVLTAHYPSRDNRKPVIVHAPTQKAFKGTECVIQTIELLKKDYEFEFILVHGRSFQENIKITAQADIIIDQIRFGSHGTYAVECMALGKPIVCYIREDLRSKFPGGLPLISANPDTLEKELRMLLESAELRHSIGIRSREYAEKFHDSRVVATQLKGIYESL
jgi:hypothetical protein